MNRKKLSVAVVVCTMLLIGTGCSNNKEVNPASNSQEGSKTEDSISMLMDLPEDYVCIPVKNCSYVVYNNFSSTKAVTLPIITSRPIDPMELTIDLGIKTTYTYNIEQQEASEQLTEFPYYVYYTYQRKSGESNLNAASEEDDYFSECYNEFQKMDKNQFPQLYYYNLTINFEMELSNKKDEEFSKVKLALGQEKYEFQIGKVALDYTTSMDFSEAGLSCDDSTQSVNNMVPSATGEITLPAISFATTKDITISGISVLNKENVVIQSASFDIIAGATKENKVFTSLEPVTIPNNSTISANIVLEDSDFTKKVSYDSILYLLFKYEVDGVTHYQKVEVLASIKRNAYECVAEDHDGIDFSDHYFSVKDAIATPTPDMIAQ